MTVDSRYRARSSMMVVGVRLTVTLGLRPPDTRLKGKGFSVSVQKSNLNNYMKKISGNFKGFSVL